MANQWVRKEWIEKLVPEKYGIKVYEYHEVKKIVRLVTNQGVKALKKVRESYKRFLFIWEVMEHTYRQGFRSIPQVIPTLDGRPGIEQDDGVWMMTDWIDGREANYKEDFELELTATALARFHKAAEGLEPSGGSSPRILYGKWTENFQKRCSEMRLFQEMAESKKNKSQFDHKIIEYTPYFYDWGKKAVQHLENSDYVKISERSQRLKHYCHHDMANHNVLLTKENDIYLIDFDYCIMDIHIHDLASLLIRNVRYGSWDMDRAYFIFNVYNRENNIQAEEIGIIKAFMEFPQEFWQVGLQYYIEKQPWEEDVFHRRLDRVIKDIPKREVFMKRFLV